jgi:hypothetical protein
MSRLHVLVKSWKNNTKNSSLIKKEKIAYSLVSVGILVTLI